MTPQELRSIREKLDCTQAEMAERMGCTLRGYQMWEDETGGRSARAIRGPAAVLARKLLQEFEAKKSAIDPIEGGDDPVRE